MAKSIKEIKRDILFKFKTMSSERHILSGLWLRREYLEKLSRIEKQLFETAVNELSAIGIIEYKLNPFSSLRLTAKGECLLFQ
ncbi:MAG: hypothetical protein RBT11_07050 [Desulfobacterales bacterium]|jgi:RIO-like serine/threonine protein kinase|nr:hypothetical protein [Desulfobacterales bacterium]